MNDRLRSPSTGARPSRHPDSGPLPLGYQCRDLPGYARALPPPPGRPVPRKPRSDRGVPRSGATRREREDAFVWAMGRREPQR